MEYVIATPRSIVNIRKIATTIRGELEISEEDPFPVMWFLEYVLPEMFENFELQIMSNIGDQTEGLTTPDSKLIRLKEDVYNGAVDGNSRDLFTVVHEIGHLLLHSSEMTSFARGDYEPKAYEKPEWQANTFAAELLMPYSIVRKLTTAEITEKYNVSRKAAEVRLKIIKKSSSRE